MLNGILWSAKLDVPADGVSSEASPEQIAKNWDRKIFVPKAKKVAAPAKEKDLKK
jgi:hypothetical protein